MSRVPGRSLKEVARWPLTDKPRRFTPPWDIEDNGACFIVRDHSVSRLGQALSRQRPESRSHDPAGVKIPLGPFSEIIKAWP